MIDKSIHERLLKIGIKVEYKTQGGFPEFYKAKQNQKVLLICDKNTLKFAEQFKRDNMQICLIDEYEPVPNERNLNYIVNAGKGFDYVLAVGSGTLNDTAKYAGERLNIPSGVLCTAPSMDGYASPVSAVLLNGVKVSEITKLPSDILIDSEILKTAPEFMIGAGVGDILGKYTCLTDWKLAHYYLGDPIHHESFELMEGAVDKCFANIQSFSAKNSNDVETLTDALIIAGLAMAEAGDSRPASAGEHHISHYLEMYFVKQGLHVPLHGVKVGMGTMVCAYLYRALERDGVTFKNSDKVYEAAKYIPELSVIKQTLEKLDVPTRFSKLNISKELFEETMLNAYTVRKRYSILRLVHDLGLAEKYLPELVEQFY